MRTKLVLLSLCCVVVGMMSMSAAAQGAFEWRILNAARTIETQLKAPLVWEEEGDMSLSGEIAGLKITITCGTIAAKEVNLELGGKLTEGGKVIFGSCAVYKKGTLEEKDTRCTVKSPGAEAGTIETNESKGELVEVGAEVLIKTEPKAGPTGNLATIRLEGAECPYAEQNQVHGTFLWKDCQGLLLTLKPKHLFESNAKNTALYIGAHSAKQLEVTKVAGSWWVKLGGAHANLEWSAK